jgi:hypothetical protein
MAKKGLIVFFFWGKMFSVGVFVTSPSPEKHDAR